MSTFSKELQEQANLTEQYIIDTLKSGKSFIVEAGAGSGKTFSLMKVIDWLEENKSFEFKSKRQCIACITYTNAAVNVILSRLSQESSIIPLTIHSFAWNAINQYQQTLIKYIKELDLLPEGEDVKEINSVNYTIGSRYIDNGIFYLHHEDVILLFSRFFDNQKFRRILSKKYPIVLIDEYQDSFKSITDQFIKYFIDSKAGIQFGFFGDSWQTIYGSNGACGKIENENLIEIKKRINFRSNKAIINFLNSIRPDLPQIAADQENDGDVIIITTEDYRKDRQKGYYKGEMQQDDLIECIDKVKSKLESVWNGKVKTLMITHKMLAKQQGYINFLNIMNGKVDEENLYVSFFQKLVEPLYKALCENDINALYDVIKGYRKPIENKKQKNLWNELKHELSEARKKKVSDVVDVCLKYSDLISLTDKIKTNDTALNQNNQYEYNGIKLSNLYQIDYSEIINAVCFMSPESDFSTEHGVKGEEYENVLFIIGRGWNNYKFDEQIYLDPQKLSGKELETYIRNRNLFYVCCSRPHKRLALLITVPINDSFKSYLKEIIEKEKIFTFESFLQQYLISG